MTSPSTRYTNEQIRAAILKTAALFETRPELYNFNEIKVPDCGSPGCMLGWIGVHLGIPAGTIVHVDVCQAIGIKSRDLYNHCASWREVAGYTTPYTEDAAIAAGALRAFANKYSSKQLDPSYVKFRASLSSDGVSQEGT